MSYEEEFDKIIRKKAGEADYPFDESNWEKTSRLLDAERAAAKKLFWKNMYVPGAVIVAIGAASLVMFNHFSSKPAILADNQSTAQVVTSSPITINNTQNELKNSTSLHNNVTAVSPSLGERKSLSSVAPSHNAQPVPVIQAEVDKAGVDAPATSSTIDIDQASHQQELSSHTQGGLPEQQIELSAAAKQNTLPEKDFGNNVPSQVTEAPENTPKNVSEMAENVPAEVAQEAVAISSTEAILVADELNMIAAQMPFGSFDDDLALSPVTILQHYEQDYYSKRAKTFFMNAEFGGTYLMGWNTNKGRDAEGFNSFGGLNFGFYMCQKTSISIGLQAYNISNIRQPFYSASDKDYGFGYLNTYTLITSNDLYYASVPLRLSYHINSSNHIGVGFNAGYLVKANNRFNTYTVEEGLSKGEKSVPNKDLYAGVSTTNFMGSVFYNARLSQRFALNAEFIYGLSDIFVNNTNISNSEKPMGIRLSIQYYLFDK